MKVNKKGLHLHKFLLKLFQNSKGDASTSMERFEFEDERTLDLFSSFASKTKDVLNVLIENIKINIKGYEARIEDTTKEIEDNEASKEKCVHEITKMENKIADIKDAIENVESTYRKIADAYSSTSKGETKELYSEIIDGAKANCDKDVEKNRSEIARLNSDIEAIKNNISEFTKVIDELNRDLDGYKLEVYKYNKALEYMNKSADATNEDLNEISNKKEIPKKVEPKAAVKKTEAKRSTKVEERAAAVKTSKDTKSNALSSLESETFSTPKKESEAPKKMSNYDATLKQIYDLTGYKPSSKEVEPPKREEPKIPEIEKPVYTDNLESLFAAPSVEQKAPKVQEAPKKEDNFLGSDFANWEDILNSPADSISSTPIIDNGAIETADQLLSPYGTNFNRLSGLVGKEIVSKDGSKVPFTLSADDLIKAVNAIDGNDLKKMKTVGPEVTILRKVMMMREAN